MDSNLTNSWQFIQGTNKDDLFAVFPGTVLDFN